jgi:hypothetical protein
MAASAIATTMLARPGVAVMRTLSIFAPALLWSLAVGKLYGIAWLRHGFDHGNLAFDPTIFVNAYGTMLALMIGIPQVPPAIVCLVALALVAVVTWLRRGTNTMNGLYVGAIIVLPAVMFAIQMPNTEFPRYFLFSAVVFVLFVADLFGLLWKQGGLRRGVALVLPIGCLVGNAVSLASFYATGRGHYVDAIRQMAAEAAPTFASNNDFRNGMMTDFYGKKLGIAVVHVRQGQECDRPPDWWLNERPGELPQRVVIGGARCTLTFERRHVYPVWGLSGMRLTLYRRVGG